MHLIDFFLGANNSVLSFHACITIEYMKFTVMLVRLTNTVVDWLLMDTLYNCISGGR